MKLSKYRIFLLLRIVLMLANLLAISASIVHLKWFFTTTILVAFLIIQIVDIFQYSFKIKNDLDNLILSFEQNDFSTNNISITYKPKFKESEDSLNRIKALIKNSRIEKEVQFNFLKILIENVPSGIIVMKEKSLFLTNKAAKDILQLNSLSSLDIIQTNYPEFTQIIQEHEQLSSELISLTKDGSKIQLSFSINQLLLLKEKVKIINFQNIKTALEKNELLAWNKLIRTMTHEIMNSVTPLISLSETGYGISSEDNKPKTIKNLNQKNIDHIHKSFKSILNKTVWLKEFVNDYKKLIRIPQPKISAFNLHYFIDEIIDNMNDIFEKENIIVEDRIEDLEIKADKNLIELVIVNLIKNAIDSLQFADNKKLVFTCNKSNQFLTLSVSDNGKGIPKDIMDQIFVPFFSTKETGSGIGLSVAKQIMQMHQGKIEVKSDKLITTFTLVFQQS